MDALEVLRAQWEKRHEEQLQGLRQQLEAATEARAASGLIENGEQGEMTGDGGGGQVGALKLKVRQLQQQLETASGGASEQALLQHFLSMDDAQVGVHRSAHMCTRIFAYHDHTSRDVCIRRFCYLGPQASCGNGAAAPTAAAARGGEAPHK
jgi:hypothetical protein